MSKIREPRDVDFIIGGIPFDPSDDELIADFLGKEKQRPEHQAELEEARRVLATLGIQVPLSATEAAKAASEKIVNAHG